MHFDNLGVHGNLFDFKGSMEQKRLRITGINPSFQDLIFFTSQLKVYYIENLLLEGSQLSKTKDLPTYKRASIIMSFSIIFIFYSDFSCDLES